MPDIIQTENLTKKYGEFTAVDNVSFSVREGEIFGILGPNGAGKTTTLEMLEGLKPITSGKALLNGIDIAKKPLAIKSLIGVQLQASSFFDHLNLLELLDVFASLYGQKADSKELLREVRLEDKAKSYIKELSGGQKQRLSIAAALVNDPKVLFLDEPTTGLDPQARRNLWELISGINKKGKTIILTTHYMDEAEILCNRIAIMDRAKIIALDATPNLIKTAGNRSTIWFRSSQHCDIRHLVNLPATEKVTGEDCHYRLTTNNPQETLPALLAHSVECGPIFDLQLRQPTLEDVFLELTGHELRE